MRYLILFCLVISGCSTVDRRAEGMISSDPLIAEERSGGQIGVYYFRILPLTKDVLIAKYHNQFDQDSPILSALAKENSSQVAKLTCFEIKIHTMSHHMALLNYWNFHVKGDNGYEEIVWNHMSVPEESRKHGYRFKSEGAGCLYSKSAFGSKFELHAVPRLSDSVWTSGTRFNWSAAH